jgi:hypothetical protein
LIIIGGSNSPYFENCPAAGYRPPEERPLFAYGLMAFGENRGRLEDFL